MALQAYDDSAPFGTFALNTKKENSRIIGVFLIKKGFDITTLTASPTSWQTGITAKDIVIINPVTGSWPEATENSIPGIGRVQTEYSSSGYDINFRHKGVDENLAFYNKLLKSKEYGAGFVFHDNKAYIPASGTLGTPLIPAVPGDPEAEPPIPEVPEVPAVPDGFEVDIIDWFARISTDGEQLEGDRMLMCNGRWTSSDLPYTIEIPESLFPL